MRLDDAVRELDAVLSEARGVDITLGVGGDAWRELLDAAQAVIDAW